MASAKAIPLTRSDSAHAWLPETETHLPPISKPADHVGPVTRRLRKRTMWVHAIMCAIGALPSMAAVAGLADPSIGIQAVGWSLWMPGGGFLAEGGWGILGFAITLLLFRFAVLVWSFTGLLIIPAGIWVLSAILAYFTAGGAISGYGQAAVAIVAASFWFLEFRQFRRDAATLARKKGKRNTYLAEARVRHDERRADARALDSATPAELDTEALKGARYLFDLALQPVGQLEGFTRIDNIQLAALRYQLNYISYGLAQMQLRYTPNFHGYLNQAQRYAIESLTLPEVCGYWKYEYAMGRFGWNPDPIGTLDNVMLTGWSLIALTTYAANTGDLRYQEPGALAFRPFKSGSKIYSHDAQSFVKSIVDNWNHSKLSLYPCEPHWTFSICNILAMCGIMPYDEVNGTQYAERAYEDFLERFEDEFVSGDGMVIPFVSALTGLHRFSRPNPALAMGNSLSIASYGSGVHAGIASRAYMFVREEMLKVKDGLVELSVPWSKQVDMGNYRRSPGYTLAGIALAAAEQGDEEMRVAALRTADALLEAGEGNTPYAGVSAAGNIRLATARWARADDWRSLIRGGAARRPAPGPILTDCIYPDVLVARAVSNGRDLDLVLYNGAAAGPHSVTIERLTPSGRYRLEGQDIGELIATPEGSLRLTAVLDGRTALHLVPVET